MKKIVSILALAVISVGLFAQGFYVEYKLTADSKEAGMGGNFKTYAQDGNVRSEVSMNVPQIPGGMLITTLVLKAEPGKMYMLNEKDKTFSEMQTSGSAEWDDQPQASYEVTVIGKETVNGHSATHVSVKINGKLSEELWTTRDIVGYADFAKIKTKYTGKDNLYKALAAKGAEGMPVRIKINERGHNVQMDIVKVEKRNNPASLFTLAGYKKGDGMSGLPGAEQLQEMMKNMKDMTPAQREELLKQIQKQYENKQ